MAASGAVPLRVPGLFGGSFDTVSTALADARLLHNLDVLLLLRTWQLAEGSADAARLCRCATYALFELIVCECY